MNFLARHWRKTSQSKVVILQIEEIQVSECSVKALYCGSCAEKYYFQCDKNFTSFPMVKVTVQKFGWTLCPNCYQLVKQQFATEVKTDLLLLLGEGLRDAQSYLANYVEKGYQNRELVLWAQRAVINALKRLGET